jgi:frataxin-like iron-binding protein CyaY
MSDDWTYEDKRIEAERRKEHEERMEADRREEIKQDARPTVHPKKLEIESDNERETIHPEPPAEKEYWVTGKDGGTHLTGPNARTLCDRETDGYPTHYRQVNIDESAEAEWYDRVCDDCMSLID